MYIVIIHPSAVVIDTLYYITTGQTKFNLMFVCDNEDDDDVISRINNHKSHSNSNNNNNNNSINSKLQCMTSII